jgi:hypothetical protein
VNIESIVKSLFIITAIVWIIIDFYAYKKGGTKSTESWMIWKLSYYAPGIAFLIGVLCGHFFFNLPPDKVLSETKSALCDTK